MGIGASVFQDLVRWFFVDAGSGSLDLDWFHLETGAGLFQDTGAGFIWILVLVSFG